MLIRFVSLLLLTTLLAGCQLFATKPKIKDDKAGLAPISEELVKAYNQGLNLLKKEKYLEAEQHWQQTAAQWTDFPGVWTNLALSQWHLEQYEPALVSTTKALEIDAEFCPAFALHGLLQRENGQFDAAKQSYEKALVCEPDNPDVPLNLGILYDLYLQDLPQALSYYQQAQQLLKVDDETLNMWVEDLKNRIPDQMVGGVL